MLAEDLQLVVSPTIHNSDDIIQLVDRAPAPSLLPILRSQQQGELLYLLLSRPDDEYGLTDLTNRTGVPYASVHREVERAETAGLLTTRRIGRTRLVRANRESPYFAGLADVLAKAFGPSIVLAEALAPVGGVDRAFIFGSWAEAHSGKAPNRPVGDIDLLVLGEPDRDEIYGALAGVEARLGREVQIVIRNARWLDEGSGSFHANVASGALVPLNLQ